jgi:two-component system sensor histidine kinase CpxA
VYENALRAALSNVVRNAALHGRSNGSVTIGVEKRLAAAVITVQDDGGGVPSADLPHLFEPFYRASRPRAQRTGGGTGLGLAIAARAISRHGGVIEARNVDKGLLVTMTLG